MFPTYKNQTKSIFLCFSILILGLILTGCPGGGSGNENQNRNSVPNNNGNKTSTPQPNTTEETKEYEKSAIAFFYTIPPTGSGGDNGRIKNEDLQEKIGIKSLRELAIALTPVKYPLTVEAVNIELYEGDKKVFEIRAASTRSSQTFPPLERRTGNVVGYPFEIDPGRAAEGDKFFIAGNTIRLVPTIKRDNGAEATFYFVNKNSEVKKAQAR